MLQKQAKWWLPIALFLVLATAAGGLLLASNLHEKNQVEIVLPTPAPSTERQVFIGGAVKDPGIYSTHDSDRLADLLNAAGGPTADADAGQLKLTVPLSGKAGPPQRININTADVWLLEALPGIGEKLARAIVAYRGDSGPFRATKDITKVPGITPRIYERIQDLITVGE